MAADDGFIRDIGQVSYTYRLTPLTEQVLQRLSLYLVAHGVKVVMVWYDAPMSRSGELAAQTRRIFRPANWPEMPGPCRSPNSSSWNFPGL